MFSKKTVFLFLLFLLLNLIYGNFILKMSSGEISEYAGLNTRVLTFLLSQPWILIVAAVLSLDIKIFDVKKENEEFYFFDSDDRLCTQEVKGAKKEKHPKRWKDSFEVFATNKEGLILKSKKSGKIYRAEAHTLIEQASRRYTLKLSGEFEITNSFTIKRV